MKVVGVYLSQEKLRKMKFHAFLDTHSATDLRFVKISPDKSIESQGPFDAILQKITELDKVHQYSSASEYRKLKKYLASHPDVLCIDPQDRFGNVLDRHLQTEMAECAILSSDLADRVIVPSYCLLDKNDPHDNAVSIEAAGLQFPIVCKPQLAHGDDTAHTMALVFNAGGLRDIETPSLVQAFVNHNGKLFKLFVLGDQVFIKERPSIRNLYPSNESTIFFHSHSISKEGCTSKLNMMCATDKQNNIIPQVDEILFRKIAAVLRGTFKLDLFGVDLIMCVDEHIGCGDLHQAGGDDLSLASSVSTFCMPSHRYAIIDINLFPSYENVPFFFNHLENFIREKLSLPTIPLPSA